MAAASTFDENNIINMTNLYGGFIVYQRHDHVGAFIIGKVVTASGDRWSEGKRPNNNTNNN